MISCRNVLTLIIFVSVISLTATKSQAQQNGYLGFRVTNFANKHGLKISSFIPNTPAHRFANENPPQLAKGDVMLTLNGRKLWSVKDVFRVTDNMQQGDPPAKLELMIPNSGARYHVYIYPAYLSNQPCEMKATTSSDQYNKGRPGASNNNIEEVDRPSTLGRPE